MLFDVLSSSVMLFLDVYIPSSTSSMLFGIFLHLLYSILRCLSRGVHSPHDWLRTRVHKKRRKGLFFRHTAASTSFAKRVYFWPLIAI